MLDCTPVAEAPLVRTPAGTLADDEGWFILNVADATASNSPMFGSTCRFEGLITFPQFAVNVTVLQPGQPNCMYHREEAQEGFLVLRGECIAIVEDQERRMRTGDYLHSPAGTAHVLVGAGDEPCSILAIGARVPGGDVRYPVSDVAARHGASVEVETDDPGVAYADEPARELHQLQLTW